MLSESPADRLRQRKLTETQKFRVFPKAFASKGFRLFSGERERRGITIAASSVSVSLPFPVS